MKIKSQNLLLILIGIFCSFSVVWADAYRSSCPEPYLETLHSENHRISPAYREKYNYLFPRGWMICQIKPEYYRLQRCLGRSAQWFTASGPYSDISASTSPSNSYDCIQKENPSNELYEKTKAFICNPPYVPILLHSDLARPDRITGIPCELPLPDGQPCPRGTIMGPHHIDLQANNGIYGIVCGIL